ncbi:MAG: DinB family protein, partial [bacterium]|nr:DinB family protein [bacterium]
MDLVHEVHNQLDYHWRAQARPRLEGLTDAEYFWEPTPGAWNVRRAGDAAPQSANMRTGGGGEWTIDFGHPEPEPAPVTSIAWRIGHLVVGVFGERVHGHFGGPAVSYDSWEYAGDAATALEQLDAAYEAWSQGVRGLGADALAAPVGEAEGDRAHLPMITLVLHINREAIHHMA